MYAIIFSMVISMNSISKNEMMDIIRFRQYNGKCNNYIFTDIEDINGIVRKIPFVSEIINYEYFRYQDIGDKYLQNIVVDMSKINVEDLLNRALEVVNSCNRINFRDRNDCAQLQNILRKLRKNVQYIFYNVGSLSYDDVRKFNDLIYFTSYYMTQVVLLGKDEDLATYQTSDKFKVLDNRENYNKLRIK